MSDKKNILNVEAPKGFTWKDTGMRIPVNQIDGGTAVGRIEQLVPEGIEGVPGRCDQCDQEMADCVCLCPDCNKPQDDCPWGGGPNGRGHF